MNKNANSADVRRLTRAIAKAQKKKTLSIEKSLVFGGYLAKLALASAVRATAAVVEKTKTLSEGMNVIKGEFYQC